MTPSDISQNCRSLISRVILPLLLVESLVYHVQGEVFVKNDKNETVHVIFDVPLPSSSAVPMEGLYGKLVRAEPEDACSPIKPPPSPVTDIPWIALIRRYPCAFPTKVCIALVKYCVKLCLCVNTHSLTLTLSITLADQ